ncbi:hypothetical protein DNTS_014383, partial [Danionella cerebrum]
PKDDELLISTHPLPELFTELNLKNEPVPESKDCFAELHLNECSVSQIENLSSNPPAFTEEISRHEAALRSPRTGETFSPLSLVRIDELLKKSTAKACELSQPSQMNPLLSDITIQVERGMMVKSIPHQENSFSVTTARADCEAQEMSGCQEKSSKESSKCHSEEQPGVSHAITASTPSPLKPPAKDAEVISTINKLLKLSEQKKESLSITLRERNGSNSGVQDYTNPLASFLKFRTMQKTEERSLTSPDLILNSSRKVSLDKQTTAMKQLSEPGRSDAETETDVQTVERKKEAVINKTVYVQPTGISKP